LDDTASHALVRASESLQGRTLEAEEDQVPNQMKKVPPIRVGQKQNGGTPINPSNEGALALY
jgi:hypothetical protein